MIKTENFLAYFLRILNSCVVCKFQTVNPWCPPSQWHTSWSTVIRRDIRANVHFCNHVLLCLSKSMSMFITVTHCSLQRVKRVRAEKYAQGRRRMESWRRHFLLCPFRRGQRWRYHFIGVGAGKIWGCKGVLHEFPQTCPKSICATSVYKFSPTKIMKTFLWCDLQKSLHMFFCKAWAPFYEVKQHWAPFLPWFSGIWTRFSANQNF